MSDTNKNTAEYKVLARKYRPNTFEDLIGQEPMVRTLSNAFGTNRIAQAYMLTGVRGVGKTTTARILARALNYQTDSQNEPTLDIKENGIHCEDIMEGTHVDVIEMDAASHTGIGDVREIIASLPYKPVSARYKVYIIDEVHMLSTAAFNGLLKTLEEPPEHVKFIFATTEIKKVPVTVLSRCQRFDLRRIETTKMVELLNKIISAEGVEAEEDALAMIARAGEGSARDAISLLDQAIAHAADAGGDGKIQAAQVREMIGLADRAKTIDLFEYLMKGEVNEALGEIKDQYDKGAEPVVILEDLAQFVHLVTRLKYVQKEGAVDNTLSEDEKKRGQKFADELSVKILGRAWQMLLKGIEETQVAANPITAADMVIVRIAHAADMPTPDDLIRQMTNEQKSEGGGGGAETAQKTNQKESVTAQAEVVSEEAAEESSEETAEEVTTEKKSDEQPKPVLLVDNENKSESESGSETQSAQGMNEAQDTHINNDENDSQAAGSINSFEELIKIAETKKDLRFSNMLRSQVSLVRFENQRIEFKSVNDAPHNIVQLIKEKIKEWSGEEWDVITSQDDGDITVQQKEKNQKQELTEQAQKDPVVSAVLDTFKNSEIVEVRPREAIEQDNQDESQQDDIAENNR